MRYKGIKGIGISATTKKLEIQAIYCLSPYLIQICIVIFFVFLVY